MNLFQKALSNTWACRYGLLFSFLGGELGDIIAGNVGGFIGVVAGLYGGLLFGERIEAAVTRFWRTRFGDKG